MTRRVTPKESQPEFGRRLEEALNHANQSRKALAAHLGISVQSVGQVINGPTVAMAAENSVRAARFLGVSVHWLATGEGTMLEETEAPALYLSHSHTIVDTAVLRRLMTDLGDLLPEDREHFVTEISSLAEKMRRYRDSFRNERGIPEAVPDARVAQHIKPAPPWDGHERREEPAPVEYDRRRVYFDYGGGGTPVPRPAQKKRGAT